MPLKPGTLRFELTAALLLKVVLLIGLWWLIFRFGGHKPRSQPDIAQQLGLNPVLRESPAAAPVPTHPTEIPHVR